MTVAVLAAVACFFLGRWQWGRWEQKHTMQSRIGHNYNASPVALPTILPRRGTPLPPDKEWAQVRMTGRYDAAQRVLVRNRPNNGNFGYEVLVPLRVEGAGTMLVDRGWVPNGPNAATPEQLPPTPSGTLTVIGWLRPSEIELGRAPIKGQVSSIHIQDVEQQTGTQLYDAAYVRMRSERLQDGTTPPKPQLLEPPDQGSAAGINFSYALQWWGGMIAVIAMVLLGARREALDEEVAAGTREPQQKKVRIWDEEDA